MGFFSSIGGFLKDTAGSIISAGSNLVGGLLRNSSASSINQSNQNFAREQFEYQKALHQNQLQWRVEDAKKAGLHPLAGIGVQAPSFGPVSASTTPLDYSWIGDLGQSANYGATKAKDRKQQVQMLELQMRGLELDNEYKQAQIDALKVDTLASSIASNQAWQSPSAPTVNASDPFSSGSPYLDKPIVRDGWILDEKGRKVGIVPSDDAAQRFEDKFVLEWIPFAGSAVRSFKGKYLGQEVNGHWWHGDDKGFLPYPPQRSKGYLDYVSNVVDFYRDYDG